MPTGDAFLAAYYTPALVSTPGGWLDDATAMPQRVASLLELVADISLAMGRVEGRVAALEEQVTQLADDLATGFAAPVDPRPDATDPSSTP